MKMQIPRALVRNLSVPAEIDRWKEPRPEEAADIATDSRLQPRLSRGVKNRVFQQALERRSENFPPPRHQITRQAGLFASSCNPAPIPR
jgi:hypothetical protein